MTDSLIDIQGLNKHFGGVTALDNFSCNVVPNEILGLIGPNGAGKTTLFNVMNGFISPDSGDIDYKGRNITRLAPYQISMFSVVRIVENRGFIAQVLVLENVLLCFPDQAGESPAVVVLLINPLGVSWKRRRWRWSCEVPTVVCPTYFRLWRQASDIDPYKVWMDLESSRGDLSNFPVLYQCECHYLYSQTITMPRPPAPPT